MLLVLFGLSIVLFAFGVWLIVDKNIEAVGGPLILFGIVLILLTLISTTACLFCYPNHLSTVRAQSYVIEARTQQLISLKKSLKECEEISKTTALVSANTDSPVKSLIEAITNTNKELGDAQVELATAKVNIEWYKASMFWWITKIYGEQ